MELKYDFNRGEWKSNRICNLKNYWQEHPQNFNFY
ncbi:hypothetical protein T11_11318 [Trichinella zimbabwensis]|uniref:Uncharacterized protein n=1 Tax=Trichinella zimbabwensis TaxID=268475 RepID=A0A0V1GCN4_9BILA|nr:hypothetical protein T11_11318 [Trichinella zimbabwensis]